MPFITQGKTNWKFLLIVIILAIIVGGGVLWYAKRPEKPPVLPNTEQKSTQEQGCINSGGTVTTASCCKSSGDFPNSCLIGACGCSAIDSHKVKTCDCGEEKCFDGEKCVGSNQEEQENKAETVIGKSVEGRDIVAYHFGSGEKEILFVGGIHGGYSWNTTLLAFNIKDYLKANSDLISNKIKVTVIPVLNPDGLYKVVGTAGLFNPTDVSTSQSVLVSGRFNANNVDINRNFDCSWKATGKWQNITESGGTGPFSEPESLAIKNYVQDHKPAAVVAFYSAAGGVFASSCQNGILPETQTIMDIYAANSGYPAYEDFNFYELSGDMSNWFAKINIPAINVILTTHDDVEWAKNLAGVRALIRSYAE